jgi:hypothetical protein
MSAMGPTYRIYREMHLWLSMFDLLRQAGNHKMTFEQAKIQMHQGTVPEFFFFNKELREISVGTESLHIDENILLAILDEVEAVSEITNDLKDSVGEAKGKDRVDIPCRG